MSMPTAILHLAMAIPAPTDTRTETLFLLATLITLAVAALRWMVKRAHVVMVISGTAVITAVLAVLVLAYWITFGSA